MRLRATIGELRWRMGLKWLLFPQAHSTVLLGHETHEMTGKNVENHVRENVEWILFKTHNFHYFLKYTIVFSKCEFENSK